MNQRRAFISAIGVFLSGALVAFGQTTGPRPGQTISGFSSGAVSGFAPNPVTGYSPGAARGFAPSPVGPLATNLTQGFTAVSPLTAPLANPNTNGFLTTPIIPQATPFPSAPLNPTNNIPAIPLF
jgi:hypothetical protein